MIDIDEFIQEFLEHGQTKEQIKEYNRQYYLRNKEKWKNNTSGAEQRVIAAEKKIQRARAAAANLPPKKRNAVMKKLIEAQKKINNLKKKIKNPFTPTTKVRVRTPEDFPKAFPKKNRR